MDTYLRDLLQRALFRLTNVASYGELQRWGKLPSPSDSVVVQFIPALAAVLVAAERKRGRPLLESEVVAIRDRSSVVVVPHAAAADVDANRGYVDIRPRDCWHDYQRLRDLPTGSASPSIEEL